VAGGTHTHLVVTGVGQNGLTIQNNERTIDFLQVQNNGNVVLSASHSVSGTYSVATKEYVDSKVVVGSAPPTSGDTNVIGKYTNNDTRNVLGEPDAWIQITIGGYVYNVPGYLAP